MRCYLCGPMTGHKHHNFTKFDKAKKQLTKLGHDVVSPADIDRTFGISGDEKPEDLPVPLLVKVMLVELKAIAKCGALVLLPGWEHSRGGDIEIRWALLWKIPVVRLEDFVKTGTKMQLTRHNVHVLQRLAQEAA